MGCRKNAFVCEMSDTLPRSAHTLELRRERYARNAIFERRIAIRKGRKAAVRLNINSGW